MINKIMFGFVLLLFILPMVMAEPAFIFKQSQSEDLKIPVYKADNSPADVTVTCKINVVSPNNTLVISNEDMSFNTGGVYNHSLVGLSVSTKGEYQTSVNCDDSSDFGFSSFVYEVNPTGIRASGQRTATLVSGIVLFLVIAILLSIAFFLTHQNIPVKWTYFIFAIVFFLISLNTTFIVVQDAIINPRLENFFEGFLVISYIFYWFAAVLLILMWAFTFLNTMLLKKNQENLRRFG